MGFPSPEVTAIINKELKGAPRVFTVMSLFEIYFFFNIFNGFIFHPDMRNVIGKVLSK